MEKVIQIHDLTFIKCIPNPIIIQRINEMAIQASEDFKGKHPIVLCVMDGVYHFASAFTQQFNNTAEVHFIKAKSYIGLRSTGHVKITGLDEINYQNRDILILEDIVESGLTIHALLKEISKKEVREIKIAALLRKPNQQKYPLTIDYVGFDIEKDFIVGFGLDYKGLGRSYPDIYKLKT